MIYITFQIGTGLDQLQLQYVTHAIDEPDSEFLSKPKNNHRSGNDIRLSTRRKFGKQHKRRARPRRKRRDDET